MNTTDVGRVMLDELLMEIDESTADLFKPQHPVDNKEQRLGTVTDVTTRKFYSLSMMHRRDEKMARVEASFTAREDDPAATCVKVIVENDDMADLYMNLFWLAVRRSLQFWGTNIGIRKDWIVVVPENKPAHPLAFLMEGDD